MVLILLPVSIFTGKDKQQHHSQRWAPQRGRGNYRWNNNYRKPATAHWSLDEELYFEQDRLNLDEVLAVQVVQSTFHLLQGGVASDLTKDQLPLFGCEAGSAKEKPAADRGRDDHLVAFDFPKVFTMLSAVGEEVLVRLPAEVVEEPLECAGHLNAVIIFKSQVQLRDDLLEAVLLLRCRVDHVLPCGAGEAREQVDRGFALAVLQAHLPEVEHDAHAVLLIVVRPAVEDRDVVVPGHLMRSAGARAAARLIGLAALSIA